MQFQRQYSFRLGEIWPMCLLSDNIEVLNPRISIKVHSEGPFLFQTQKYSKELKK